MLWFPKRLLRWLRFARWGPELLLLLPGQGTLVPLLTLQGRVCPRAPCRLLQILSSDEGVNFNKRRQFYFCCFGQPGSLERQPCAPDWACGTGIMFIQEQPCLVRETQGHYPDLGQAWLQGAHPPCEPRLHWVSLALLQSAERFGGWSHCPDWPRVADGNRVGGARAPTRVRDLQ